jgi:hypothetical protein
MQFFNKSISNLIENQFPEFYKEEGPVFIEFVKAYYEWLEEYNNPLYDARRLMEYGDIDSTVDKYLEYFKNKYLNNIQKDTAVSTQHLVKHSLDLYRSKGTERAIDLFFKSIFGVSADVYYPGRDILKTSSGEWIEPLYIEVATDDNIKAFEGKQIIGLNSGATAFVDKYIRKKSSDSPLYSEVFYISDLRGDFITGEKIKSTIDNKIGPVIIGSMNSIVISTGSSEYKIGDIVNVYSNNNGRDGKARVKDIQSVSGKISLKLENGGWGYTPNSQVLISEKVLKIDNITNLTMNNTFKVFETVIQPLANVGFNTLSGLSFNIGDIVYRKNPTTNTYFSPSKILNIDLTSETEGYLLLNTYPNNFSSIETLVTEDDITLGLENGLLLGFEDIAVDSDGFIYKIDISNTEVTSANILSFEDSSAYANVMKQSSNLNINISNSSVKFIVGEEVVQYNNSSIQIANAIIGDISYSGTSAYATLIGSNGYFYNSNLYSKTSNASGYVDSISISIGLIDINNDFVNLNGNKIYGVSSNTVGSVNSVSIGTGANFIISNTLIYEEDITLNTDIINDYLDVTIDSPDYGFPAPGSEDSNTLLEDAFTYVTKTYGRIKDIAVTNSGNNYNHIPYIVIYEKDLIKYNKKDFIVNISNTAGTFLVGEVIEQNNISKGVVKNGSNSSVLLLERITFNDIELDDIIGLNSGATAYVDYASEDINSNIIGLNAIVLANTTISNGSITSLEVIDSGFGYYDNEPVLFKNDNHDDFGSGTAKLIKQGKNSGFHRRNDSVLNSNKYLQDSYYYQEFSYEIRSPLVLEKYASLLKNVIHMSGTKYFSRFIYDVSLDVEIKTSNTVLTIGSV